MEAKSIDADGIFTVFTACPNDPKTLILDVRPHKEFKRKHINQAYCVRVSSNRQVLADYSQSSYSLPWSQHCWWGKPVIVYGPAGVSKDHDVVKFLTSEGRCTSVHYFKPGFEAFELKYPFICTPSVKANSIKKYPSMVLPGFLYLGDWADAQEHERLKEIGIKRIVTIHNHPERLSVPAGVRHLKLELADVEGADISPYFNEVYEFLADAEQKKQPTLVHCGAGVSRSACLVMMYLMRSRLWSAQKARDHCIAARSLVCPNDGFWRVLCALEGPLGILNRSDPEATMGFAGADAPPAAKLDKQAAGLPITVKMITAAELKKQQQQQDEAAKAAAAAAEEERRRQAATAAAAAAADRARREAEAAAAAQQDEKQQQEAAEDAEPQLQQKPRLKRGRSPGPSGASSKSTSSSSSSDSGSSSNTSSSSSDTDTSTSSDSSSGSEVARARSRSLDRNKPRHRSPSLDRAAAAARRESLKARSGGDSGSSRKRRHSSSSRSRSPERGKLRRGGGEGLRRRSSRSRSRSRSGERAHRHNRSKHTDRVRDRDRDRDRATDRDKDRHRESNSDRGRHRDRAADRDEDRDRGLNRAGDDRQRGRSRSRDGRGDQTAGIDRRKYVRDRDRLNGSQGAAAAAATAAGDRGGRSDRSRRHDRSSSRDRHQQQQQGQATDRSSSKENGQAAPEQPPAAVAAVAAASSPAAAPTSGAAAGQSGWLVTLEVTKPEGLVGRLVLGPMNLHQRVVFGRAPSCNIVLEHLSVSRQHAQLYVDLAGTVNVMDMGAAHGTKLNDTWIKPQQPKTMPVGSQLRFGASTRVYTLLSVEKI